MTIAHVGNSASASRSVDARRTAGMLANRWLAVVIGVSIGALTSVGQTHLEAPWSAFVNSASAWLVAPFLVGALATSQRSAIVAGAVACASQLIGYYVTSELRGFAAGGAILLFWAACSFIGGPLFGLAGYLWRRASGSPRGLGAATLASAFVAEGLWTYLHVLGREVTAALWIGIGAVLAVALARKAADLRWLAVTIPAGLLAEVALSAVYRQAF